MPRWLRRLLLGSIAACQVYLFAHAREPLRLDIGDPWSDANVLTSINYVKQYGFLETSFTDVLDVGPLTKYSYHYTHYPPLAEITYGAIGKYLGVEAPGTYRLFALVFSAAAMWFLFLWSRRMWGETVALVATALWQGSLMWLLYADSIHQAPIFQLSTFGALVALERAIATGRTRFYVGAAFGAFCCFFTSYDGWLFFPAAVLMTVWVKSGNPFGRGNRHFVAICAAGCVAALVAKSLAVAGAVGWHEFVADLHFQFLERSGSTFDRAFGSPWPTLERRFTQVFSPLVWLTIAYHAVRAVRAPSLASALRDTSAWMLACGLVFLSLFAELAATQLLPSQVMLPFYAIGTAIIIERLLERGRLFRVLACAWLVTALAWGAFFFVRIPRAVMPPDEVAKVNEYLAAHDHNDFVLNNLLAAGQIQWGFQRHDLGLYSGDDTGPEAQYYARLAMFGVFKITNVDSVTAIVFTDPDAFYLDKSLWPLVAYRRTWSIIGSPYIWYGKAHGYIDEYQKRIVAGLRAVDAERVLELPHIDVYRIDRSKVMDLLGSAVPFKTYLDITGTSSSPNRLLGWGNYIVGTETCPFPPGTPCRTILTKRGSESPDTIIDRHAELMIRVPDSCDLHLRVRLQEPAPLVVELNGFQTPLLVSDVDDITVPRGSVMPGINIVRFDGSLAFMMRELYKMPAAEVRSVEILSCQP
jgi:hypothetical protein